MLTLAFGVGTAPGAGQKVSEWRDDCDRVAACAFSRGDLRWLECPGVGVFAFSAGSHEVRVWPEPDARHETITDTFSRMLQPIILQALGEGQVLHAAATVGPAGLLAFCGRSGSGKSTLAFAMQEVGCRQFADDALLLRFDQDRIMAHALPFMPRLRPASRAYFPHARYSFPSSIETHPASVPLSAVFLLQQTPSLTSARVSLMPPTLAFSELLPLAHCFDIVDPTHMGRLADDYLRLVACVPTFRLEYRPDLENLPLLTRNIVQSAARIDGRTVGELPIRWVW
jgi:hypothetical protein